MVSQVQAGMSRAVNAIRNFFSQFSEVGQYLMQGLANGIRAGIDWVVDAAKGVAERAVNAAKSALGIASLLKCLEALGVCISRLRNGYLS